MDHEGERTIQRLAGVKLENWGSSRIRSDIPPVAAKYLAAQRMVVLGAATDDGAVWASLLTGSPGFVEAPDNRTVVVDALPGPDDPTFGLFDAERDVGLIAVEPVTHRRMRVNGPARRDGDRLVIRSEQVFANCQRYIQTRVLVAPDLPTDGRTVRAAERLDAEHRRWIAGADTFFVATRATGLGADVSHRGGNPGFVTVVDDRRLSWPDYPGNLMYMTLGNLELDPHAGLLFLDWERGRTLQLAGRARISWDPDRAAAVPGAQRLVDFDVDRVIVTEAASPLRWSFKEPSRFNPS